jgi:hypothetical protein
MLSAQTIVRNGKKLFDMGAIDSTDAVELLQ